MADTSQIDLSGGYVPVNLTQEKKQLAFGWYPTYIVDVKVMDRPVKGKYRAKIYNLILEVANEVKDHKFTIEDIRGEKVEVMGDGYQGKTLRSIGIFYFLTPQIGDDFEANPEGQVNYKRFCDALNINMPKAMIEVNGEQQEVYKLTEISKEDLVGKPVMGFLGESKPWKGKDGKTRTNFEIKAFKPWDNAPQRSVLDEIPF